VNSNTSGKELHNKMVYFVGAGPGAPDLITVRGADLLREADMIIYAGSLVNEKLLLHAKDGCKIMNSAEMTLEQVIEAIRSMESMDSPELIKSIEPTESSGSIKSMKGQVIVRLHTGDPSIYGAIREQMDELDKYGIDYEVVPGVSSFCAAAAALKAEYTLPGVSQSVIITRMEGRTAVPPKEDIALFAAHGATMVLFLSAGLLREAEKRLIAGGYSPDTPAAIVYKASWPDEKVFKTTISGLYKTAQQNNITKTALVLVGRFLGENYERSKLYDPSFAHEFRDASR
jgi:precorrin-4/cobalt-precorrin-4 C11-methyltransferase